jgi:hypothetical protein
MSTFIRVKFRAARRPAALLLIIVGLTLLAPTAHATRRSFPLADGVIVTLDVGTNQTLVTLTGASTSIYRLECSEDLSQWTMLNPAMRLGAPQTFTYTDGRVLPKCFYRITILAAHP